MVENRNGKKVLITPVTAEDLADIHIGDIVYLDVYKRQSHSKRSASQWC